MNWLQCTITPLDVLANTDTRGVGYGMYGQSGTILPQTVAGAIRAHILSKSGFQFGVLYDNQSEAAREAAAYVGHPLAPADKAPRFRFSGPFIWRAASNECYFPVPVAFQCDKSGYLSPLIPENRRVVCDRAMLHLQLLRPRSRAVEDVAAFVNSNTLCDLLRDAGQDKQCHKTAYLAGASQTPERRWGQGRNELGVVKDGELYSVSTLRFAGSSSRTGFHSDAILGFVPSSPDLAGYSLRAGDQALLTLGGKGHLVSMAVSEATRVFDHFNKLKEDALGVVNDASSCDGVVLYLATPSFFRAGWHPDFDEDTSGLHLSAAAVGPSLPVSGWDMSTRLDNNNRVDVRGRPKAVRNAAPAGACYFYELKDREKAKETLEKFHFNQSLSCEDGALGYGLALFGVWRRPPKKEQI